MKHELNPCPQCGADAAKLISRTTRNGNAQMFFVVCTECLFRTRAHYADRTGQFKLMTERAVKSWNEV